MAWFGKKNNSKVLLLIFTFCPLQFDKILFGVSDYN